MKININFGIRFTASSATVKRASLPPESTNAFISATLVMLSKLNGRKTAQFSQDMKTWTADCAPFLTAFGIRAACTKIFNVYNVKGTIPEEMANDLGKLLKSKRLDIEQNTSISASQVKLLKDIDSQLRTQSLAAWNRIHKDVRFLANTKLSAAFPLEDDVGEEKIDVSDLKKVGTALKTVVKRVAGREGQFFTQEELKNLRVADPDTVRNYSLLIRQINPIIKKELFNYVRASGKTMVSVDEFKAHLNKKSVPNNIVVGFTGGQVDDVGKYYTAEGRPVDSAPFGTVKMNPKYDPSKDNTYVMMGDEDKRYRTTTFVAGNKTSRFSLVGEFIKAEATHRAAWTKDLTAKGRTPVLAAMVELIHATSSRIGGAGNATAGEPTYGMSTLQVRHLSLTPTLITYDYTGKKLARQGAQYKVNDVVSKRVLAILTELVKGKAPTDNVFTYKGKPVLRAAVNIYLKSLGIEITIHNMRNVAGTKLAMKILKGSPFKKGSKPTQAKVEAWVKEALKEVGVLLHHRTGENVTSGTALKSYIDPSVVVEFFTDLGLRSPTFFK